MERIRTAITPLRVTLVLGMMGAIFLVSSQPGDKLRLPSYLNFDKAWHMLEYGALAITCLIALPPASQIKRKGLTALGLIGFACLYGLSDEFHQSFVPLRDSSLLDVLADTLGAALVAAIWWWRTRQCPLNQG